LPEPHSLQPRLDILPPAQRELWSLLGPAAGQDFVLYGGTAVALRLGHRQSIDFDFFSHLPLDKSKLQAAMPFLQASAVFQDEPNTLVLSVDRASGPVKLSFFGGLSLGRVGAPSRTSDGVTWIASQLDLLATKLKAILDRAEAKDYVDLAALLRAGLSLEQGLGAFQTLFKGEAAVVLKAVGYFSDGDLDTVPLNDRTFLRAARDSVRSIPDVRRISKELV
jgi:hypothetical protein